MPASGSFAATGGAAASRRATVTQSASVLPVILSLSRSAAGASIVGEQPLVEAMKITPVCGSAAGGPVMFAPPPPPGQMFAGPLPSLLPRCVGGANSGASRSSFCARSSASFRISGV